MLTNKRDAREYFLRMARAARPVVAQPGRLNLSQIQSLGHTTGGWFADLKISDVSTAGIFGTSDIVDSDEWTRYANVGDLSAVNMRVASRAGVERAVQVTKDRLILLMQNQSERDNLDFVEHLNAMLDSLDPNGG